LERKPLADWLVEIGEGLEREDVLQAHELRRRIVVYPNEERS
jgi:hypothetical protein